MFSLFDAVFVAVTALPTPWIVERRLEMPL